MLRYRCDDCDYECNVELQDESPYPDSCVLGLTKDDVKWVKSIIVNELPEESGIIERIEKLEKDLKFLIEKIAGHDNDIIDMLNDIEKLKGE